MGNITLQITRSCSHSLEKNDLTMSMKLNNKEDVNAHSTIQVLLQMDQNLTVVMTSICTLMEGV